MTQTSSPQQNDVALVFAVDCSTSMDAGDYALQMRGIADALRSDDVYAAIQAGANGRIAVSLVQWSTKASQAVTLPWREIATASEIAAAAGEIEHLERQWQPGGTGLAAGILFCAAYLARSAPLAQRYLIDVSGDGQDNEGGNVAAARNLAVAAGITINGLPLTSGSKYLAAYYRTQVIGGPNAFLVATDYLQGFKAAMTLKLVREIRPVSV